MDCVKQCRVFKRSGAQVAVGLAIPDREQVAIGNLFLENASKLGLRALQSRDRLARKALFATYPGGNSVVTAGLGTAAPTLRVDSVVGFESVAVNGAMTPVSATSPMTVTVGTTVYTLIGTTRDAANLSSLAALGGASGTAPSILRPNGRAATSQLVDGDRLSLQLVLAAVARLCDDNVPDFDGTYHCYLDDTTLLALFQDPDFKQLYCGSLGRFQEIIAQTWKWRGGFCVPTDVTANPTIISTASPSYWKRAVVIECL